MKKFFRKMDEMEMHNQLQSLRWSWFYSIIFLAVWSIYELLFAPNSNAIPSILLTTQTLLQICIKMHLDRKMGEDEE